MLQGELDRIDLAFARLSARRAKLAKAKEACEQSLAYLAERHVPGLPTVRAHREYGRRGALQKFLETRLHAAVPARFSTAELALEAMAHFGLTMSCPKELLHFKTNTVGRALRRLQKQGVIERLHTSKRVKRALGTWRWVQPDLSLDGLRSLQVGSMGEEVAWPSP